MSKEHAGIERVMGEVLSPDKLRNPDVTKVCWNCGKEFHPYKGFEFTSHFCSCECSNEYCYREVEKGEFKCRNCGKVYKDEEKTHEYYGSKLCSKECKWEVMRKNAQLDLKKKKEKRRRDKNE